jgi:hypothetical protein
LAHLVLSDAADLVATTLEQHLVGYHQYLPAVSTVVDGLETADLIADHYPDVPLRRPAEALDSLIDITALESELGWAPKQRLRVTLRTD